MSDTCLEAREMFYALWNTKLELVESLSAWYSDLEIVAEMKNENIGHALFVVVPIDRIEVCVRTGGRSLAEAIRCEQHIHGSPAGGKR